MSKGMLSALLVSVLLALVLSLLPDQALSRWGSSLNEVREAEDVPVTNMEGVVDQLGTLSLQGHLRKVVYEKEKLTVWLAVPGGKLAQDGHWSDIYKIAYRFLVETPELREVEVKVVTTERPDRVQVAVVADSRDMVDAPKPNSAAAAAFVQNKMDVVKPK